MFRFAAVASALAFSTAAMGEAPDASGIQLSLTVPEVCHINASPLSLRPDHESATGVISEFCNANRGFQVVASHRELEGGEAIWFTYGEETRALNRSGISGISNRRGPSARQIPVAIRSEGLRQSVTISLGMAAI